MARMARREPTGGGAFPSDLLFRPRRGMDVGSEKVAGDMHLETEYLRLRTPVALGSRFNDWQVCWLGGWAKHRVFYLVMVVRVKP